MHHEPNVRFVDAHAECDRRDDDLCLVTQKQFLVPVTRLFLKPGVIAESAEPLVPQICRQRIDRIAT